MLLSITILGEPIGQGRPRAVRKGKHVRVHSAPKSAQWEALAADRMRDAWTAADPDRKAYDGPVSLHVTAYGPRPKSMLKRLGTGAQWRTTKPDLDNIVKSVSDALVKAGVLRDDVLVARITAESYVCPEGEPPCTFVCVGALAPKTVVPHPPTVRTGRAAKAKGD